MILLINDDKTVIIKIVMMRILVLIILAIITMIIVTVMTMLKMMRIFTGQVNIVWFHLILWKIYI